MPQDPQTQRDRFQREELERLLMPSHAPAPEAPSQPWTKARGMETLGWLVGLLTGLGPGDPGVDVQWGDNPNSNLNQAVRRGGRTGSIASLALPQGPEKVATMKALPALGGVLKQGNLPLFDRAPAIIRGRGDRPLNIAVAMEQFGHTRDAFRNLGHNAVSIDLAPDRAGSPHHIQGDVFKTLDECPFGPIDALLGHPSCQYLASSGIHWNSRVPGRAAKTDEAAQDFMRLYNTPGVEHVAIENPVGVMSSRFRPPDQYVQPHQFGADASKRTGLWLKNLSPLTIDPAQAVAPRMVVDPATGLSRPRWGNQTDSGQNVLGPSPDRAMQRAETYPGIAKAMATQFSEQILRKLRGY